MEKTQTPADSEGAFVICVTTLACVPALSIFHLTILSGCLLLYNKLLPGPNDYTFGFTAVSNFLPSLLSLTLLAFYAGYLWRRFGPADTFRRVGTSYLIFLVTTMVAVHLTYTGGAASR